MPSHATRDHARQQLHAHGWIARRSEAFHHLPPPALAHWLPAAEDATPAAAPEWSIALHDTPASAIDVRWLNALDSAERSTLLQALPAPGEGIAKAHEAAPFAWAHRALCRQGLHLHIPARADGAPVVLTLTHQPAPGVQAPTLIGDVAPGARCLVHEVHPAQASASIHNLHAHIRVGAGAHVEHLRCVTPGAQDQWAHHVHASVAEGGAYHQALVASDSAYHLQRHTVALQGTGAQARQGALLLLTSQQIDHQATCDMQAAHTDSAVQSLVLARAQARAVSNAYTRIAPGAQQANVFQRLTGIPLDGAPRLTLRPHLEILHDNVQAAHGATWGALPADALFYARQRGLDETSARALITQGMAQAVLERALPGSDWLAQWLDSGWLAERLHTHAHSPSEAQP